LCRRLIHPSVEGGFSDLRLDGVLGSSQETVNQMIHRCVQIGVCVGGEDPQPKEVQRSMRRPTLLAALVLAIVLIAAVPVVASEARASLEASLTGEKEVPGPGDPNGRGEAEVKVHKAKVCYELEVERIKPATFAHIHRGAPNVAGDIVVELKAPTDGSSEGCKAISKQLSKKLREHPGRYYVNVHNEPYPDGAIRGQLHRGD
jgi:CHRD domain